jgi:hypothetical protein
MSEHSSAAACLLVPLLLPYPFAIDAWCDAKHAAACAARSTSLAWLRRLDRCAAKR